MQYWDFVAAANCRDADPKLFDAVTAEDAAEGIEFCRTCTVWSACEQFINPSVNCYDGIAVGAVWKDGRMVAMLKVKMERTWDK